MNKLAKAVKYANIAMAANYFLRAKTAAYRATGPMSDFDCLTELANAAAAVAREKQASVQEFGVTDNAAVASALYDAAKGILRMRNIQQL